MVMLVAIQIVQLLARGGGGGSSSGGSGGGGIVLAGYLPMHFLGAKLRKRMPIITASILGWPAAVLYSVVLILLFKSVGFIVGIGAIIGIGAGLYGWFDKIAKLVKKAKTDLRTAASMDAAWNEQALLDRAREVFFVYQQAWSNNNIEPARGYISPWYYQHAALMVEALKQAGRQDFIVNPQISDMQIVQVQDVAENTNDSFTVMIVAQADDQLFDMTTKTLLFRDSKPFTEFWHFDREGDQWLLQGIEQGTRNPYSQDGTLQQFAVANHLYYSSDWGWLLLPNRGQLFHKSNFGRSDINNHVIGLYNNTLIQLYNYIPFKTEKEAVKNYLVAQISLPKSYGNIVVRRKRMFGMFSRPKNLTRLQTEWNDFNARYELWASDLERVTSFELLHPAFMVKLQELPFEVNLEVVDSVVYLYSAKVKPSAQNYQTMLTILQEAFKQMRM